jgi:hypothetical protein
MRVPRTHAAPWQTSGLVVTRSRQSVIAASGYHATRATSGEPASLFRIEDCSGRESTPVDRGTMCRHEQLRAGHNPSRVDKRAWAHSGQEE